MDQIKIQLKTGRSTLTKSLKDMQSLLDSNDCEAILKYKSVLTSKYDRLEQANNNFVDKASSELNESEFEDALLVIEEYRDKYDIMLSEVNSKLTTKSVSSASHCASPMTKLPRLDLPSFSGDVLEYNDFRELFITSVDSLHLTSVQKFSYLKTLLKAEASSLISGLELNDANYAEAIKLLDNRYGSKVRQQRAHIRVLLTLDCSHAKDAKSLRSFVDSVNKYVRALATLGFTSNEYKSFLSEIIIDKVL